MTNPTLVIAIVVIIIIIIIILLNNKTSDKLKTNTNEKTPIIQTPVTT